MNSVIVPGAGYQFLNPQMIQEGRALGIFGDLDLFTGASGEGSWIHQTGTGAPVIPGRRQYWRYRSSVQRVGRNDPRVNKLIVLDGALDLVNDPNAYSHNDTWAVLGRVISVYRGYEKHYGSIPRLKIIEMDDYECAAASFDDSAPAVSIPLGFLLDDGTPTWPSNLMLRFQGPNVVASDYQEYAREVLSKLAPSGGGGSKTYNYPQISMRVRSAANVISDAMAFGKAVVSIVEGK